MQSADKKPYKYLNMGAATESSGGSKGTATTSGLS